MVDEQVIVKVDGSIAAEIVKSRRTGVFDINQGVVVKGNRCSVVRQVVNAPRAAVIEVNSIVDVHI